MFFQVSGYTAIKVLYTLMAVLVVALTCQADDEINPPEAMKAYANGKRLLREGDWWNAAKAFEQLAGRFQNSPDLDRFIFYRAKAKYYLGEYDEAIAGFSTFLSQFPQSEIIAHVQFYLANSYYRRADIGLALDHYLESYRLSREDRLNRQILESLTALFENAKSINVDKNIFAKLDDNKRCELISGLVKIFQDRNQTTFADELAASCTGRIDSSFSKDKPAKQKGSLQVAVVVPLSGELQQYGEDIYNGVIIASEMFRQQTGKEISLVPYDTKGDPVDAARIIGELIVSSVDAVIGPLTSDEAAVASARSHQSNIPLVIPAATQAGLTKLSESSFQLSPNFELEGIRTAEYAVTVLKADSAAIITSTSPDHLRIARAFVDRFEQLGGTIVAIEYYRSRDKDFGLYIRDIKAILHGAIPDSVYYLNDRGDTIDVDGLPAQIDCLFLPGDENQIRLLLPQIHFYNLNGAYLGSDGWGDESVYRLGDNITKEAVFPSPFLSASQSNSYSRFAAAYDARYGQPPGRLANLGYDALTLIAQAYTTGATSPAALTEQLKQTQQYEGASGVITFGSDRENTVMPFFRISGAEAIPVNTHAVDEIPDLSEEEF